MDKYSYLSNEARAALADVGIDEMIKNITSKTKSKDLFFELVANENKAHNRLTSIVSDFIKDGFVNLSITYCDVYSKEYFIGNSRPNISTKTAYGYRIKGRGKYKLSDDIRCSSHGMKLLFDKIGGIIINKENAPAIRAMIADSFGEAYKLLIEISIKDMSDEIRESLKIIPNEIVFEYVRTRTNVNIYDENLLNPPKEMNSVQVVWHSITSELDGEFSIVNLVVGMLFLIGLIINAPFTIFLALAVLFVYLMCELFN